MLSDYLTKRSAPTQTVDRSVAALATPKRPLAEQVAERRRKKRQKAIRPGSTAEGSLKSLGRRGSLGEMIAAQVGGAEGKRAQRRRKTSAIAPLGGFTELGV